MMDTLKSYFGKIRIMPGHGQKSWKFNVKGERSKNRGKGRYSRSKSQGDAVLEPTSRFGLFRRREASKVEILTSDLSDTERGRSPPAKPPRKDIYTVSFRNISESSNLGIVLGSVCMNTSGGFNPSHLTIKDKHESLEHTCYTVSPIKVCDILEGSVAHKEGSLQAHDEIIQINDKSLQRETIHGARHILDEAVKSGNVLLKVRRQRERPTENSFHASECNSVRSRHSSTSSLKFSCSQSGSKEEIEQQTDFFKSALYVDNEHNCGQYFKLNSLNNSNNSLTISNDDVFTDGTSEYSYYGSESSDFVVHESHWKDVFPYSQRHIPIANNNQVLYITDRNRTRSASSIGITSAERYNAESSENELKLYLSDSEVESTCDQSTNGKHDIIICEPRDGTPTDACSLDGSELHWSCDSSPAVAKKRVITKLHLVKENNSLGLHIAGGKGSRRGDIGIFVAGITENGPAHRDGRMKRGDELLMINGRCLIGVAHQEAVEILRSAPKLVQLVIASKKITKNGSDENKLLVPGPRNNYKKKGNRSYSPARAKSTTITVNKGLRGKGLGFTVVGGRDTAISHLGIIVKRVFDGGIIAEDGRLKEGDEILELNNQFLGHLTHKEVIRKFRGLKNGPVTITFRQRMHSPRHSPRSFPYLITSTSCDGSPVSTPGHSPHNSFSDLCELDRMCIAEDDPMTSDGCDEMKEPQLSENDMNVHRNSCHPITFSEAFNKKLNNS